MRVASFLVLPIIFLSALLLYWSINPPEPNWQRLVPADLLAVAVIDRPDRNLELLSQGSLGEWLTDSLGGDIQKVGEGVREKLEGLITVQMRRVCLLLHELEHRQESTFKVHFSLLLEPDSPGQARMQAQLDHLASRLFGSTKFDIEHRDQTAIYRGAEPRQVLYYPKLGRCHLVSNSQSGWEQVVLTWKSQRPRLSQSRSFIEAQSTLPDAEGVLVFSDLSQILTLLPKFGYWIGSVDGEITEQFHVID